MSNTTVVTLPAGQMHSLETSSLPSYNFRSGNLGAMQISPDDDSLIIKDEKGKVIFSCKRPENRNSGAKNRVTVEDTPDGTTVIKIATEEVAQPAQREGGGDGPIDQQGAADADDDDDDNHEDLGERSSSDSEEDAEVSSEDSSADESFSSSSSDDDRNGASKRRSGPSKPKIPRRESSRHANGRGSANRGYGHIMLQGIENLRLNGNVQSATVSGSAQLIATGTVQQGIRASGTGSVTIYGNVRGGITASGVGRVYVAGDVYGDIIVSGMASVTVQGRQRSGYVYRSSMCNVQIKGRNHYYQ